jgi:SH3-like domain-containing protein
MRSGVFRYATRCVLAIGLVIATSELNVVHAAQSVGPDSADVRSKDKHPAKVLPSVAVRKGAKPGEQKGHAPPPVAVLPPPVAPPPPPVRQPAETGEPAAKVPRFAALKTDETNMRKGPGQRYPIDWVYQRRDLPVEVEREYDVWRYVRDAEGVQGWVHQVTLSDRRTFVIQNQDVTLRAAANDTAGPVAMLKAGVIGRLRECDAGSKWCEVQVGGYKGYLRREQIWGLLPDEVLAPS